VGEINPSSAITTASAQAWLFEFVTAATIGIKA
jgi:hypothetical protein